jgi:hypothetical protein
MKFTLNFHGVHFKWVIVSLPCYYFEQETLALSIGGACWILEQEREPTRIFAIVCIQGFLFPAILLNCRIEKDLNIATPKDWYRVTREDVVERGGENLFTKVCAFNVFFLGVEILR